jgi:L-ascorbate metabolism protein UlaG (beta-lactamase superfamily)
MKLRLIRHATLQIEFAGQQVLVDPLLAEPGTFDSLTFGSTARRNPTVALPCPVETLLQPDIILVTHSHFDHFDSVAKTRLPKQIPLVCQPTDQAQFQHDGFTQVIPVASSPVEVNDLQFFRTEGRHGKGIIGRAMGHVSGFMIQADQEPLLYIAGDTVWGPMVQASLEQYRPEIIVLNTGAAQFNLGAPITMTADDVVQVCRAAPQAKIIAVHLEAINHCRLKRQVLADYVAKANVAHQVMIPMDGQLCVESGGVSTM